MNDRTIRVRVPSETFDALEAEARKQSETLAGYLRPLLVRKADKVREANE